MPSSSLPTDGTGIRGAASHDVLIPSARRAAAAKIPNVPAADRTRTVSPGAIPCNVGASGTYRTPRRHPGCPHRPRRVRRRGRAPPRRAAAAPTRTPPLFPLREDLPDRLHGGHLLPSDRKITGRGRTFVKGRTKPIFFPKGDKMDSPFTSRRAGRAMTSLTPLESLLDRAGGDDLPLPTELAALYGPLRFPLREGRPYVIGNFVTTLDGVAVALRPGTGGRRGDQRLQPARSYGDGHFAGSGGRRDRRRRDAAGFDRSIAG